jgi:hypothetical protein
MYSQPQKNSARKKALQHAVEMLTAERAQTSVVPRNYIRKVRAQLEQSEVRADAIAAKICDDDLCDLWESFWDGKVGEKAPNDLVVAYLAGPEPLNDFDELVNLGIHPHNIYAFESDKKAFNEGLLSVKENQYPLLKIIKTSLDRYLQSVPQVFDIIYFDACGPLPSNGQATLRTVSNVFRYQRLNPLGVLITNFAQPDISDENQLNAHSDLIANYLYPKSMLESGDPEWNLDDGASSHGLYAKNDNIEESFFHTVKRDFSNYYGQYITRQIFDIGSFIAPVGRFANSEMWQSLFDAKATVIAKDADNLRHFGDDCGGGDYIVDPDMYALGWTLAAMNNAESKDVNYPIIEPGTQKLKETWLRELGGSPVPPVNSQIIVDAYNVIRINDRYCTDELKQLLNGYKYMQNMRMFCDVPTSELALYAVISQYSYPSHYNVEKTKRYTYVADGKNTEMFLDVIAFDTCRYIYDWLPSTELVGDSFSDEGHQLVYRFALDGLAKHTIRYCNEYFYGAHVIGVNNSGFTEKLLKPREVIA